MEILPYTAYDRIIVSFSGGKDSIAMTLKLLDDGVDPAKIELWHQCIDGDPDTAETFFDWPATHGYVREFAKLFNLTLAWQWREGGIHGEMERENELQKDTFYQYEGGEKVRLKTTKGKASTRRKFPAKTADLNTRWCSAIKVDTARRAITNIPEFKGSKGYPKKILFLTGERAEESPNRAKLTKAEVHKADTKSRIAHHWRPVINWTEQEVWDKLKAHKILPHPAYFLGFPRLSCMTCIFFSPDHWATLHEINPEAIHRIARKEAEFNHTLDANTSIFGLVEKGKSMIDYANKAYVSYALNEWTLPPAYIGKWVDLPKGAFGKGGGSI